jgi:hypothetical protein
MIVFDPFAAGTLPITVKVLVSVVVRRYPERALIRRTAPVARVPSVVTTDGIPVAIDEVVSRARAGRPGDDNTGWRWRPDVYAERYAGKQTTASQQR